MKTKASTFFKQMLSTIVAVVKAKSTAVRAKTSTFKTRLLVLGILRNRKLLVSAINHKIHAIMGQDNHAHNEEAAQKEDGRNKAIVLYTSPSYVTERDVEAAEEEEDSDDEYLTHSLFREEDEDDDELVNAPGSVIDVVRDAKEKEGEGAEFRLEDEIDHVADVFIRRIHKQLKLQKLESFKRFCEMMERSA
ncbi:hypothetical protein D1007_10650 [Hordeum vulgare]|uniref:Predicted protein n=1 Tax=Hordeum vulgare subsp. vulgare TaxID=112509 RepID=F2EJ24_HORVV|nr:uncharacterized protein LOC123430198 [Hordeum vulgare subsp. vulgare]KAE8812300.1 hypothetical protein D1007_10650 [Hordeum vulgare]KAI5015640.1 hypothetical protein ZWY2020_057030 [Hordeum vulgare]BAK07346.1 predicted protein [Hordeum vulgare subsp. vulgare]